MGACFNTVEWDGKLTNDQLKKKFQDYVQDLLHEHGHDAYNGTFSTCSGLHIQGKQFGSGNEAYEWLSENCQKWEAVIAVKFEDKREVVPKPPTFNNKTITNGDFQYRFLELSELAAQDHRYPTVKSFMVFQENNWQTKTNTRIVYPADQLTELQRERLKKDAQEFLEARDNFKKMKAEFDSLIQSVQNYKQAIPDSAFTQLKKLRKSLVTARSKCVRIAERLQAKDEKFHAKLWKTKIQDNGLKWMLGGWCAE